MPRSANAGEIINTGQKPVVWLQEGFFSPESKDLAKKHNLEMVEVKKFQVEGSVSSGGDIAELEDKVNLFFGASELKYSV